MATNQSCQAIARTYFPSNLANSTVTCWSSFLPRFVPVVSRSESEWFSRYLESAGEPPLFELLRPGALSPDVIRLTWLRSFHPPIIVRVVGLNSSSAHLIAKQLSGPGGYGPGVTSRTVERRLTSAETTRLEEIVATARLTTLPGKGCEIGLDGAEWVIEMVDATGYHFLQRWSPKRGEVRDVGIALLKLTGWRVDPVY